MYKLRKCWDGSLPHIDMKHKGREKREMNLDARRRRHTLKNQTSHEMHSVRRLNDNPLGWPLHRANPPPSHCPYAYCLHCGRDWEIMQFSRASTRKNKIQKISQQERGGGQEEGRGGLVLMLGAYWYARVCWDRKHSTTTA